MKKTSPSVYIIILNWNGFDDTVRCLESLKKNTYINYKVILVDNASNNNEGNALKKRFGNYINLIQNERNFGFAKGNNIAIKYALQNNADYVVLLNNDTKVEANFLEEGVKLLEKNSDVGFVVPKILYGDTNKVWWSGTKLYTGEDNLKNIRFLITQHALEDVKLNRLTDCATGCALFMRASALKKIGLFDESYFMYLEDIDLSLKLRKAGYKIMYFNSTIVRHYVSHNSEFIKRLHNTVLILKYTSKTVNRHFSLADRLIWHAKLPFTIPYTFLSVLFPNIRIWKN